jgi:hypothetical protein
MEEASRLLSELSPPKSANVAPSAADYETACKLSSPKSSGLSQTHFSFFKKNYVLRR